MALKTYVGARYAPKFMGAWNKSNEYAALSVVYSDNQSYVSRKTVPAETEITNTEYWIRSSDWNAQVDQYRNQVDAYDEKVVQYNQNVEAYNTSVNNFFEETIHAYNTKEDMVKDQSIKEGYTLITCGETAIGDGSGAFYQAVTETSSGAVALENGLFAKKFQLMPERFNRWTVNGLNYIYDLLLSAGDIITSNCTGETASHIYAPALPEKQYTLNGWITECEYLDEYSQLADAPMGDLSTFFLKSPNSTYRRFRILKFVPNNITLNSNSSIYLLPNKLGTNETPLIFNGTSVTIGEISSSTYILHMHGTPNSKIVIPVTEIGRTTAKTTTITATAYPSDFFVTLSRSSDYRSIVANSTPVAPAGITNCNISVSGSITTISNITSFIIPTVITPTNGATYIFNLGGVGDTGIVYTDDNDAIDLRSILVPFNASASVTIKVNIGVDGESSPETEIQIPTGRSLFMVSAKYAQNTHAFTTTMTRFL